jgi:hypothetical protein
MEEQHGRVYNGALGIHERAKKVLVIADFVGSALVRYADCIDTRISSGSIYLYVVLMSGTFFSI